MGIFIFPMITLTAITLCWLLAVVLIWHWEEAGTAFGSSISNINGGSIFRSVRCGRTEPVLGLLFISTSLACEWG
jgi:hypothetical protein